MKEILGEHKECEDAILLFEIGDFTPIQRSADLVKECGYELMNSLKFNEVDWTIVAKKG
jgi:NADH-quinone oxidoreductase subunit E